MRDTDPVTPPTELTRGYIGGILAGAALLAIYCLLNILVDPTGEFDLSGRFAFNRAPPPAVVAQGESEGNPDFYRRAIRESQATTFLLGQSRTWRGFDTCGYPDMLRIAGSAWGISELGRVQRTILMTRSRPITLLVEIGLPQDEREPVSSPVTNAVSVALSPQTALFSLQTIAASLGKGTEPKYTYCKPHPSPPTDWAEAARTLRASLTYVDANARSLLHGQENVMAMAAAADRICERTGLHHNIIYFSLPATPARSPAIEIDRIVRRNSHRIAELFAGRPSHRAGCNIVYRNFTEQPPGSAAQQALWRDRNQWSDYAHYLPALGNAALANLLKTSGSKLSR